MPHSHRAAHLAPGTASPCLPHEAVPGITDLWRHTRGDPAVTIGIIDGPPDVSHPSLAGADLHLRTPWWLPPTAPQPEAREHGTFTASVLVGQHKTELPGLVPGCRVLALPHPTHAHLTPDPHSCARAVEELVEAGADIIQYTFAHHTASGDADDMLKRAINSAIDAGILVTAPAGNDYGRCGIAPAILPGVLAVGAQRADGTMFRFSNHGPLYRGHGITARGEAVLGAQPGGGIKARKGTCVAVALVTGAAALLVSLQRHLGHHPDPLAVRDALLATARPCNDDQAHGEPERCLNGALDLPAATRAIASRSSLTLRRPDLETSLTDD